MDMYAEIILDHYRNPQHYGKLEAATATAYDANPLCGDKIEIGLLVKDGVIEDAQFNGEGCAISQASASMLLDEIIGKKSDDVLKMENQQVYNMLGVELTTARVKCALLSLVVVKKALITSHISSNGW